MIHTRYALDKKSWSCRSALPNGEVKGAFPANYLIPLVISPNPLEYNDVPFGIFMWSIIGSIIAVFGAFIGTYIVKRDWKLDW